MSATPLAKRVEDLLQGVHDDWRALISMPFLEKALIAIDAAGDTSRIAPPANDVFNFLRDCLPTEAVAAVMGQDPYPTKGHATGYCFGAWKKAGFPKSLQPIMDCLVRSGLIKQKPPYGDLRPVAVQGVLFINAALTTREGAIKAHVDAWKPFMDHFLEQLCKKTTVRFLLWGNVARDLVTPHAKAHGRETYFWSHPSPQADNQQPEPKKFANCDHFTKLNTALTGAGKPPIWWALDSPIFAFTDGSCPKNGAADAEAGFGVLIIGGHLGPTTVRGMVEPKEYSLIDTSAPELGFEAAGRAATPTNNRGELLAFCWAMLALLRGRALGPIEIVSDSEISVKTLNEWLPNRRRKGTAHQLKNFDLIEIAETLLTALKSQADSVTITHVEAAHDRACPPKTEGGGRAACLWHGNRRADEIAKLGVTEGIPLDIRSNIAPVRRLV